jgi:hypothetical protein
MHLESVDGKVLAEALQLAAEGHLQIVMDPACPFEFSTEGVRGAFNLHESHHACGKVVIGVAHESEQAAQQE